MFRRRGRPFGDEEKTLLIGRSLATAAVTLADEFDEPGNEAGLVEEMLVLVREAVQQGAQVMPGVTQFVALSRAALPVAVASNSPRHLMDVALDRPGWATPSPCRSRRTK